MTAPARIAQGHWWDRTNPDGTWNGKIFFDGAVLQKPKKPHKSSVWAVWNDLFHCDVAWGDLYYALSIMQESKHDTFAILTKRPRRMEASIKRFLEEQYLPGGILLPPHFWLGISASDQDEYDAAVPHLFRTPATTKILSLEPLLGPIDILRSIDAPLIAVGNGEMAIPSIQGVIVGGETGPHPRPMDPDWARSIRDQCQTAGIPFFFKQHGGRGGKNRMLDGRTWDELPGRVV